MFPILLHLSGLVYHSLHPSAFSYPGSKSMVALKVWADTLTRPVAISQFPAT